MATELLEGGRLRICIFKFYFTFINLSLLAINLNVHLESSEASGHRRTLCFKAQRTW